MKVATLSSAAGVGGVVWPSAALILSHAAGSNRSPKAGSAACGSIANRPSKRAPKRARSSSPTLRAAIASVEASPYWRSSNWAGA